ncbi:hypothetical protein AAH979_42035 [Plantactinospora sp. ZYX-F-223]|uniref:hypothetical protein n=1 Tax=Plantactinospora sp. ZYX-F-223 TaxID=3144103 RepID=UPI0031FE283C
MSTSLVDDEGVDLVFHRRGSTATLAVQVKARMSDSKRIQSEGFVAFVRSQTFVARDDLDMLFVAIDVVHGIVMKAWLVPSKTYASTLGDRSIRTASPWPGSTGRACGRWSRTTPRSCCGC